MATPITQGTLDPMPLEFYRALQAYDANAIQYKDYPESEYYDGPIIEITLVLSGSGSRVPFGRIEDILRSKVEAEGLTPLQLEIWYRPRRLTFGLYGDYIVKFYVHNLGRVLAAIYVISGALTLIFLYIMAWRIVESVGATKQAEARASVVNSTNAVTLEAIEEAKNNRELAADPGQPKNVRDDANKRADDLYKLAGVTAAAAAKAAEAKPPPASDVMGQVANVAKYAAMGAIGFVALQALPIIADVMKSFRRST